MPHSLIECGTFIIREPNGREYLKKQLHILAHHERIQ
jgi:hypothetical protein